MQSGTLIPLVSGAVASDDQLSPLNAYEIMKEDNIYKLKSLLQKKHKIVYSLIVNSNGVPVPRKTLFMAANRDLPDDYVYTDDEDTSVSRYLNQLRKRLETYYKQVHVSLELKSKPKEGVVLKYGNS